MSNDASETMGVDAQMGIVRILRAYPTFAELYQGETVAGHAVALSEGGIELDEQAGQVGYDPRLISGVATPLGAKCLLWLPILLARSGVDRLPYVYTLYWRMRNTYDYNQQFQRPYHFPKQAQGVAETLVEAGPRVVIPAACPSVTYVQPEPAVGLVATQNMLHENFRQVGAAGAFDIINSDGARGAIQQGIAASSPLGGHLRPAFTAYECIAAGDELVIVVTRGDTDEQAAPNWDFAGVDGAFNTFYGDPDYPDLGVYVLVGTGP
ncbi:MAG: hypothetical protein JRD89_02590 [Deltaproteobacteria bacterium]|nr:hypothetical protein [Deltaproteobacteria bacterium]